MTPDDSATGKRRTAFTRAEIEPILEAARMLHYLPEYAHAVGQTDKVVLAQLAWHLTEPQWAGGGAIVCPSILSIAVDTGLSERQVERAVGRLVRAGLIERAVLMDQAQGYDISPFIRITPVVHQIRSETLARLGESDPTESGTIRSHSSQN